MVENSTGDDTLIIHGGNNQFAVTYKYADAASGAPVAPQFGAVGSLNNTDPRFDFSALDNGKVYTVMPGQSSPVISGGNQQFAVEYILPAGTKSAGGYGVQVEGGNNAFVVANNVALASDAAGNTVSVDGGNNAYVVSYPQNASAPNGSASVATPTAQANGVSISGRGIAGEGNQSGVIAGTPGNNSVNVNGGNNQYVVNYGSAASSSSGSSNLMPGGVGMSGSVTTTAAPAGMPSTASLTELLKMSPFGRILDIPGVTPDRLIAGFASATAGNGAGGSNPFAGVAPGTNPFSGLGGGFGGGSAPAGGGSSTPSPSTGAGSNPFGGAMSGSNPFTGGFGGGSAPAGGGSATMYPSSSAGSNPFGGTMSGSNPFGSGSTTPTTGMTPTTGTTPTGSGSAPTGSTGSAPSADQAASLLQQSPFGALLQIPGFTVQDLTDAFSSTGGDPFGGNPFEYNPASGAVPASMGGTPSDVAAMGQSFFAAIASGSTPAEAYASFQNGSNVGQTILAGVGTTGEAAIPSILLAQT